MRHDETTGHFQDCETCRKLGTTNCGNDCNCGCYEPIESAELIESEE